MTSGCQDEICNCRNVNARKGVLREYKFSRVCFLGTGTSVGASKLSQLWIKSLIIPVATFHNEKKK